MPKAQPADHIDLPEVQLLLACARVNLDAERAARIRDLAAGPIHWPRLVELAARHGLRPLLYRSLNAACGDLVPAETLQALRAHYRANTLHNLRLTRELLRVLALLEENDIPAIPLKGPVLAEAVWGDLGLRESGDLDVLVREEHAALAMHLLAGAGYEPEYRLTPAQEAAYVRNRHELGMLASGRPELELHWRLAPRALPSALPFEQAWARCEWRTVVGREVAVLCPEDLLFYLCIHGIGHGWGRLGWLCDLAEVLRTHAALDWQAVRERARALYGERMLCVGLLLAEDVMGAPLPADVAAWARSDRRALALAAALQSRLFRDGAGRPGLVQYCRVTLMATERLRDRVASVLHWLAIPSAEDWLFGRLPSWLDWIYLILRPVRMTAQYGLGLRRSRAERARASATCRRANARTC